jgi:IS30 family transposase
MGKCYEQLSLSERIYLQSQLELGFKAAAIAAALKREPSTIGRELRRNGWRRSARGRTVLAGRPRPPHGLSGGSGAAAG